VARFLFVALIVLVAMSLAGIALMRSVDTNVLIAGNLAFRQGATARGDWGVEDARTWITANAAIPDRPPPWRHLLLRTGSENLDLTGNESGDATTITGTRPHRRARGISASIGRKPRAIRDPPPLRHGRRANDRAVREIVAFRRRLGATAAATRSSGRRRHINLATVASTASR
jgi:hypothetical protein